LVDAWVSGHRKVGRFLDRIEKAFDGSAFEALLSPIHGLGDGSAGLSAFDDVQDLASWAAAPAL